MGHGEDSKMDIQQFVIPEALPGLNEIIGQAQKGSRVHARYGKIKRIDGYRDLKKSGTRKICYLFRNPGIQPGKRTFFEFFWIEANQRRDPDNISSAGRKLILDAMVSARILQNDGWKQIAGWKDEFKVARKPMVIVLVREV